MSSLKMGERRSSRSLANSRLTGKSVRLSTVWRQARQAWKDVPHATNTMRRPRLMLLRCRRSFYKPAEEGMHCNCLERWQPANADQAYQEVFEGLIVGDDAIMYNNKLMFIIRYMRVAVDGGRLPVYVATSQLSVCLIN
ncbi:MAG: hypothetical protein FRX49_02783 [Trebouxia sp. A1-2]|nr:MAG: hypothetical protein FRX49_02783 [Trebouxia sp. A1-2]